MPSLRTLNPFDVQKAVDTAVAAPRNVRHAHTARTRVSQANAAYRNPPHWLVEMDLTPWGERRAARIRELTRP